jgi:exopolysaccharide biosynthesis polyprenyl glycosylphosphotransferase
LSTASEIKKTRFRQSVRLPISERRVLLAIGDLAAVNLAILAALRIWAYVGHRDFDVAFLLSQAQWFVILNCLWIALASANDFYDLALTARWARSQLRLGQITLQLLVVYLLIFFFSPRDALPRLFILYYAAMSYVLIAIWRLTRPFLIGWVPLRRRVLIAGSGWAAQAMIDAITTSVPDDYEVVGLVSSSGDTERDSVQDDRILGTSADLLRLVDEYAISEVILTSTERINGELFRSVMECYERGIPITPMPFLYERLTGMVPVEYVAGHWNIVLPLEGRSPFDPYPVLKRLMDLTLCCIGFIIFAPLFPLIALAIKLDSSGPIFYTQERTGKAGRTFQLTKLRSMTQDAEKLAGPIWAVEDDPRITRVGRFLRKSRLDELPQLVNILRGEMSMIGPRPERPYFVERLERTIPFYRTRLTITPGITGWAQVNYGYGSTESDALIKLKYDLYYIRHRSILLDLLILMRTIARVIRLEGT